MCITGDARVQLFVNFIFLKFFSTNLSINSQQITKCPTICHCQPIENDKQCRTIIVIELQSDLTIDPPIKYNESKLIEKQENKIKNDTNC